jgi:glucose-6-phosphate 1-epimerase
MLISRRTDLDPTAEIAKMFPHPFHLSYVVTLAPHQLSTDLHVVNPIPSSLPAVAEKLSGAAQAVASALPASIAPSTSNIQGETDAAKTASELKFQALLHTYIRVEDASKVKIKGLKQGLTYVDKTKGGSLETWQGGDLTIQQETDRWVAYP